MASEAKCVSVMLLMDFSKVFDSVDHDLLYAKLADQFAFFQKCSGSYQILFESEVAVPLGQWIFFDLAWTFTIHK
jgi:hypothetical protein